MSSASIRRAGGQMHILYKLGSTTACLMAMATTSLAISFGQQDDFQNGTVMGWMEGVNSPNPPVNVPDGGPQGIGDNALFNTSSGTQLGGSRAVMFNQSQWTGDYLAAGVAQISGMIRVPPSSNDVTLRLAIEGPKQNRFATINGFDVPKDNQWHAFSLSLEASELRQIAGLNPLVDTLSSVVEFRLLSNTIGPSWIGDTAATQIYFDNLLAEGDQLLCDFNSDANCDITDIDLLVSEVAIGGGDQSFDLTGDSQIDLLDVDEWRAIAGAENLSSGNPYLPGDADLDGSVDAADFIMWNDNKFSATGLWSKADFTADGTTDAQDFLEWNVHKFTSANVPEPLSQTIVMMCCLPLLGRRRTSSGR